MQRPVESSRTWAFTLASSAWRRSNWYWCCRLSKKTRTATITLALAVMTAVAIACLTVTGMRIRPVCTPHDAQILALLHEASTAPNVVN